MCIKEIRLKTKLSQREFAERFAIPLSTLRKWEQQETSPSDYLINLLLRAMPEFDKDCLVVNGKYYINHNSKTISDRYGNSINYDYDISEISENNLGIYLDQFFDQYYELKKQLENNFKYDKKMNIEWEVFGDE